MAVHSLSPSSRMFGFGQSAALGKCILRLPWGIMCCPQAEGQFGATLGSPELQDLQDLLFELSALAWGTVTRASRQRQSEVMGVLDC